MSQSPYILEATAENFEQAVLENSARVPVLVDFWADWCAPCRMLMPVLAGLVEQYQGKFLVAKVNSDEQQALTMEYGVRSLPTVKLFRNGQVVDEFMGALPEGAVREFLDRHVERASDRIRQNALNAYKQGDPDQAVALLQTALGEDPNNHRLNLDLARILIETGRYVEAGKAIATLSPAKQEEAEVRALKGRLEFATVAADAAETETLLEQVTQDPGKLEARYQLSARLILKGDFEAALDQLLEIMRRDRKFRDDAGRKGMIAVFEMLDNQGPVVGRYRARMSSLLY